MVSPPSRVFSSAKLWLVLTRPFNALCHACVTLFSRYNYCRNPTPIELK